ncbi:hypothetical protein H6800_00380 [Candidatus Nomurabacteria bacterium]|nr:hypothetical protein [Candidatus Nomurabacteria bacterium]
MNSEDKNSLRASNDDKLALMALETIMAAKHLSKKQIYLQNFLRGMFFSIGTIVGIVLVGTVVLWFLSLFDNFPFIQQISETIKSSL